MSPTSADLLRHLGAGASITSMCEQIGWTRQQFDDWWRTELAARQPQVDGTIRVSGPGPVEIARDRWGIPHVSASSDDALFFGFGFVMAQDRLWQMDYLRRRAHGRLAEILGPDGLSLDVVARTVGIPRIAREHVARLPRETLRLLEQFSDGVNAGIAHRRDRLPIEFALLDYAPEPWSPLDSMAILGEFRWYLTGRLFVIALPELAKRTLQDETLYRAFLMAEAGDEPIVPPGSYAAARRTVEPFAASAGGSEQGGSNNWAVTGARSVTGSPLLASDPHIAFGTTGCWYEAGLSGGSFDVAGMAYVGVPAIVIGRNPRVAWGITNNICSQRDLYQERTDAGHPGCFLYDGAWEPAREIVEEIRVKGGETVRRVVRFSRNGPIVDELLPEPARHTGPVAMRWMGAEPCDELTSALRANRAATAAEFREALREWRCPTWSFVFADVDGHVGYQCVGRIPIRENWDRGYRPGWDPAHQWRACIPYDEMPAVFDPASGWVRSANNLTAPRDYPYPLSNTSSSGHRALRIRQMLQAQARFDVEDFQRMQLDTLSLRAVEARGPLLALLDAALAASDQAGGDPAATARLRWAADALRAWDCRMEPDAAGAAVFEVFFARWSHAVAGERFTEPAATAVAGAIGGLALSLLAADPGGWFTRRSRVAAALDALRDTVETLVARCGPDPSAWTWGCVHRLTLRHVLSDRGDLGLLLDRGGVPVRGSGVTVCNTGYDPNYMASIGANYRMIADLASTPPALWAIDAAGVSGDPGSPHYCDQLPEWLEGRYHQLTVGRDARREPASRVVLEVSA
ncbi:MAG: penicillin acylase family protein [Armatimonadota bacterium]|nr:penicillin acylase family protein [Armatimonadota bacterium]